MAFRWHADDGPTLNAGLVAAIFQGSGSVLLESPYIFVIFQGGPDPFVSPSGSAHVENAADLWQKNTGLCSVKSATIGYTLSARASLRQSIHSYVVTTIHGYATTAQIFNSLIHFFENDVSTASEINNSIDCDNFEQLSSARRKHSKRFICAKPEYT